MISMKTTVTCPCCGGQEKLNFADYVKQWFEMDGCMSYQVEYEVERSHRCPACGESLESFGSFWEYPEGTVHMVSVRTIKA